MDRSHDISEDEMRAFVTGRADAELTKRIVDDLAKSESYANRFLTAVEQAAKNSLDINWKSLLSDTGTDASTVKPSIEAGLSGGDDAETYPSGLSGIEPLAGIESPAIALGDAATGNDVRWSFRLSRKDCIWQAGDPTARGEEGVIEIVWRGDACYLSVDTAGFLECGPNDSLEVTWRRPDGTVQGQGQFVRTAGRARLESSDQSAPRSGEKLELAHQWKPDDGNGWKLTVTVEFS